MSKAIVASTVTLVLIAWANVGKAGDPPAVSPFSRCVPCAPCCPDDYCKKPWPGVPCPAVGCCCDDYCPKPLPHLPCPVTCCQPDCYCSKPLPCVPGPFWSRWFACPPPCSPPAAAKK